MIELLVLRHGQSQADLEDRHEGRADYPLTDLGREQARRVGAWLAGPFSVDRILASTLIRAAETAQIVAEHLNASAAPTGARDAEASGVTRLEVEPDPALMEFNNGELAGMLRADSKLRFGPLFGGRTEPLPHERFPGGESMVEMRARAEQFFSKLLAETADGQRVLLVSHGGLIAQLFRAYLSLPVETRVFLSTGDTGLHHWEVDGTRRRIRFTNSLVHLEGLTAAP